MSPFNTVLNLLAAFFLFCRFGLYQLSGQALPVLSPGHLTHYDIEQGLPSSCVKTVFLDEKGILWLNPCPAGRRLPSTNFYKYDTYTFHMYPWRSSKNRRAQHVIIREKTAEGIFIASLRYSDSLFLIDPVDLQTQIVDLNIPGEKNRSIEKVTVDKQGRIFVAVYAIDELFIYQIEGTQSKLLLQMPTNPGRVYLDQFIYSYLISIGDELWFFDITPEGEQGNSDRLIDLVSFNRQSQEIRRIRVNDFFSQLPVRPLEAFNQEKMVEANGQLVAYFPSWDQFLRIDPKTRELAFFDPFSASNYKLAPMRAKRALIEKDESGNVLFLKIYPNNELACLLQDTSGRLWDYTPIIRAGREANRY